MNRPADEPDLKIVDVPPPQRPQPRLGGLLFIFVAIAAVLIGGGTALSYYVDSLWFDSLGYGDVFWTTLNVQTVVFAIFAGLTFVVLYGSYLAIKPAHLSDITGGPIMINGQPLRLPVEPVLRMLAPGLSALIALATGAGMGAQWPTLALYWYGRSGSLQGSVSQLADPIFGRPVTFYLFTLPAWQVVTGWLLMLAVLVLVVAGFFAVISGGSRVFTRARLADEGAASRGLSLGFAAVLLLLAVRMYLGRFERVLEDHTIFSGVTYTEAHVTLTGMLFVAGALVLGAAMAVVKPPGSASENRLRWLGATIVPAALCYAVVTVLSWYVSSFIVRPNELVRETPYIAHNIRFTRQAFALDRITEQPFPAETSVEALDAANNQDTLQNIRLWDWRALQDTLRQIQAIRTYYDFPDIDIDRYEINGSVRQVMLAARELNADRLPESSRNWINEKLIYTHGYGATMNLANGFTPEGLPALLISNMPVRSAVPNLAVTRPEIYFGEVTNTDVYVRTGQQEFNYPQGEINTLTTYEGDGGIVLGGFLRRVLIALERGDVTRLPFSDDITAESRLLMRRNIRDRVARLAPFLTFDPDPYLVIDEAGRFLWILDGYTTSARFPYSRHYRFERGDINYLRNSVKAVVDAYDGTATFYVFDAEDPVVAAYRALFPSLFKDAQAMPPGQRKHVRYPELMLKMQAAAYGLYHVTAPEAFYNREDLWTVANEVGAGSQGEQATLPMEPNFVLMRLPGQTTSEFIEILPFTPANRNNLIGWIAGRSDEPNYGGVVVYKFPETKLVDGPLQIEARIDQNPQLSGQLSLWNQQGSRVRRGSLIVIPIGRALLYVEPIYLQAERSPMPELRIVVVAVQERLGYGPTFESALAALLGSAAATLPTPLPTSPAALTQPTASAGTASAPTAPPISLTGDVDALVAEAARNLAEYQQLTAEGRLGEAGQRLEVVKRALEQLANRRR